MASRAREQRSLDLALTPAFFGGWGWEPVRKWYMMEQPVCELSPLWRTFRTPQIQASYSRGVFRFAIFILYLPEKVVLKNKLVSNEFPSTSCPCSHFRSSDTGRFSNEKSIFRCLHTSQWPSAQNIWTSRLLVEQIVERYYAKGGFFLFLISCFIFLTFSDSKIHFFQTLRFSFQNSDSLCQSQTYQ